jgi:hypothetical protein
MRRRTTAATVAAATLLAGLGIGGPAGAAGGRVLDNGKLTVTFDDTDPTEITGIIWGNGTTLTSDYVAAGGEGCAAEFFGESLDAVGGATIRPVAPGFTGTWTASSGAVTTIGQVEQAVCPTSNAVPVRTTFTIGDDVHANTLHVVRTLGFGTGIDDGSPLFAFVPRLPYATYDEVLYGTDVGTVGSVSSASAGTVPDWGGEWYALNAADEHGMLVLEDPANPAATDGLHVQRGGASASNSTAISYASPGATWSGQVRLEQYLCFYDATTWPVESRATSLPAGCEPFARSVGAVSTASRIDVTGARSMQVYWSSIEPGADGTDVCVYAVRNPDVCLADEDVPWPGRASGWLPVTSDAKTLAVRVRAYTSFAGEQVFAPGVTRTFHATVLRTRSCRAIYGETCTLKAGLVDRATGKPVPGMSVQLWRAPYRTSGPFTLLARRTTNDNGVATYRFTAQKRAAYQWRFQGAGRWLGSVSDGIQLGVHFRVTAHVTKTKVAAGRMVKIWGRVFPGIDGTPIRRSDWSRVKQRYVTPSDDPSAYTVVHRQELPNGQVAYGYVLKVRAKEGRNRFRIHADSYKRYLGWHADVSFTGR